MGFGKSATAKPLAELLKGNNGQSNSGQGKGPLSGQSDLAQAPAPKSRKMPPIKSQQKPYNSQSAATPPLVLVDPKAPNNIAPAQNPLASGPLAAKPVKPSPQQSPQHPDQQQPTDEQNPTPAQQPSGGKAGAPDSGAGKPIPTAEFESEPFAMYATQLEPGRVIAQHGRKLITREIPDIDVRGQVDLEDLLSAVVVLHIKIDDKGNVTDVKTIHSSGSDAVDLPCERAAATWWFEPRKDPDTGRPTPDEFDFAIKFK
jgi:TonB family protein